MIAMKRLWPLLVVAACGGADAPPADEPLHIEVVAAVETRAAGTADGLVSMHEAVLRLPTFAGASAEVLDALHALFSTDSLFDMPLDTIRADPAVVELDYRVLWNEGGVLDIEMTLMGVGAYPWETVRNAVADTRTGRRIMAADLFEAQSIPLLVADLQQRVAARMDSVRQRMHDAGEAELVEVVETPVLDDDALDRFSVGAGGITFIVEAGMPHAYRVFEPEPGYLFTWQDLGRHLRAGQQYVPTGTTPR